MAAPQPQDDIVLTPIEEPESIGAPLARVGGAFVEGVKRGLKPEERLGFSAESAEKLRELGIIRGEEQNLYLDPLRYAAETILGGGAAVGDAILRGAAAAAHGVARSAGQIAREFGSSDGMANRLERDALGLIDAAAIVTGTYARATPGRVTRTETNVPPQAIEAGKVIDSPPPVPVAPIAPEAAPAAATRAGNINLSRIYAPEDVKDVISLAAKENAEFMPARRGKITHEETREMAQLVGMTPEKLAKRMTGEAFNAEQMFAARELLVSQATKVRDLARRADGGTDVEKAQFAEEMTRLVAIQEQVSGATAEAGRALSQFRMMAQASKQEIAALVEAQKTGGMDDWIRKINDLDDPAKVAAFANSAFKAKTSDMLLEAWINALLSGPTTHATNILSNTLIALWSIPERVAASGISKVTGSGISAREGLDRLFGFLEGAKEGIPAGWRAFRTENPSDAAQKLDVRKFQAIPSVNIGGAEIGGKQVRIPGRLLTAEDEFFKAIGYRQEINTLARRKAVSEGLKGEAQAQRIAELRANPTGEMIDAARNAAAKQTFTNPLGKAGQSLMELTREVPALRVIMPFVRTPVNIVKFAGERSPFAPLFKEVRENLSGKKGAAARDEQLAKIALGSAVSAVTAYSAAEGNITGGGPTDPKKRALLYASGWQPYSVKVGNHYYAYSRLEPMGMLMGVAADALELSEAASDKELEDIAYLATASVSRNLVSKTWLRGVSDAIEAFNDPERYGKRYIQQLVGTVVPTVVAQAARAQDPYLREARTIIDTIRSRIPGEREKLFMRRDVFGEPIKLEGALGPDLVSPIYQSAARNDPAIAEMLRLDVTPGSLKREIRGVELEDAEFDTYSQVAGAITKAGLNTLVGLSEWRNIPDELKSEMIGDVIRKSRDLARMQTLRTFPGLAQRIAVQSLPAIPLTEFKQ